MTDIVIVQQFRNIEQPTLRRATIVDDSTVAALFDPGTELLLLSPSGITRTT